MRTLGGMSQTQPQQPQLKGAYRGFLSKRTAPSLRKILNAQFSEKILENKDLSAPLVE